MKRKIGVLCAVREEGVIRTLMQEMDDGERCLFSIARSGTQALSACAAFVPDILVTDDVLPGLDGPALVDRIRARFGGGAPIVIAASMMPFSAEAFLRRGVRHVVSGTWAYEQIRELLLASIEEIEARIDWGAAALGAHEAGESLKALGMREALHGFEYLSYAAALAALDESRLYAIGERIYAPIAGRFDTTAQNVERLIRHAVESTMDSANASNLYAFFGNTIDPMRGKPTNAQMIAMLAQKVRLWA